ncbi:uncharacterized protein LOC142344130 [Convolutriloba macropyga]|uniref:uncharacterized protein LOC142344130 n=1 Tax=Convolutriloba macropyga TaxID=536237 RepID=UPI003F51F6AE
MDNSKTLFVIIAMCLLIVSFVFACFAHSKHGWEDGSLHGGLWEFCHSDSCADYHSSKLRAARAFFIMDILVALALAAVLGGTFIVEEKLLTPAAAFIGVIHFLFLLIACSSMTAQYDDLTGSVSWGTVVPWLGWIASLVLMAELIFLSVVEMRSGGDNATPAS